LKKFTQRSTTTTIDVDTPPSKLLPLSTLNNFQTVVIIKGVLDRSYVWRGLPRIGQRRTHEK